ncbi:MAG: DMT family transporter [Clostridiales bacterium]|nr:DMT family transporter [Clostridiales bacterium]
MHKTKYGGESRIEVLLFVAMTNNHIASLLEIVSVIVWAFAVSIGEIKLSVFEVTKNVWMYTGGLLAGCVVALSCVCVRKLSAITLTLIMFIGQLFTGVLLDYVLEQTFSLQIVIGGLLITIGLIVSFIPQKKNVRGKERKKEQN